MCPLTVQCFISAVLNKSHSTRTTGKTTKVRELKKEAKCHRVSANTDTTEQTRCHKKGKEKAVKQTSFQTDVEQQQQQSERSKFIFTAAKCYYYYQCTKVIYCHSMHCNRFRAVWCAHAKGKTVCTLKQMHSGAKMTSSKNAQSKMTLRPCLFAWQLGFPELDGLMGPNE